MLHFVRPRADKKPDLCTVVEIRCGKDLALPDWPQRSFPRTIKKFAGSARMAQVLLMGYVKSLGSTNDQKAIPRQDFLAHD